MISKYWFKQTKIKSIKLHGDSPWLSQNVLWIVQMIFPGL